jgi:DNA-binding NtrC family response regulator
VDGSRHVALQLTRAILVFDEDPEVRGRLRLALVRAGHDVDDFGDHRDALRALRSRSYDLLIADVFGRSGRRLREHLRRSAERAPLVAITRDAPLATLVRVMRDLAFDFIRASADVDESMAVVRRALAYADLGRELRLLELAGGVMNTARYERVLRRVDAAVSDLQLAKQALRLRARARANKHQASA